MKYIASCSGGKDSIATIILAHENNEPLDLIIFSEVMFDKDISGELLEHIDFIKNKAFPIFESWGYETKILRSDKTYLDCFYHEPTKGKRKGLGLRLGFPMVGRCIINDRCKLKPIRQFCKNLNEPYMQYVGIAVDEPKRLERVLKTENQISLLYKYGYTESMAKAKCEEYCLLSPVYKFTKRGGCWFCPNSIESELRNLRNKHPELWSKLLKLEKEPNLIANMWNPLTKTKIHDWEQYFSIEEKQIRIEDVLKF